MTADLQPLRGRFYFLAWLFAFSFVAVPLAAQPSPSWIRVALVRGDQEVNLQVHGGFTMHGLLTGNTIHQGRRLRKVAVRAVPEGIALGKEIFPIPGFRLEAATQGGISLNGKRLRGTLEILRQQDMTLLVINHVGVEDYLRGVLSKEAPDYWPLEALKAIAIVARSYALYQRFTKADVQYDVTGDVMSQDYGGKSGEKAGTTHAVNESEGAILLYEGKLFPTFYHSTCGGVTEHARVMGPFDLEPLQGSVVCDFCSASPFYRWQRRLTKADLGWALKKSPHGSIGSVRDFRVTARTASGRAEQITITGATRNVQMTGFDFRALLGFDRIRSPQFTISRVADSFVLQGAGWGHGVGMCQWGAAELARRGYTAEEILAYYYPNTHVVHVQDLSRRPITVIGGSD